MGFSQAVSGMNAAATNLDVIGNNIANSETSGFKAGSVSFADVFASSQVGLGVKVAAVTQNFKDGTVNTTDNGLNVAISNNGFFRLVDDSGSVFYSRNGDFSKNSSNELINSSGLHVTGYAATGTPPTIQQGTQPVNLTIPAAGLAAKASTSGTMVAKLNSSSPVLDDAKFDAADSGSYSFSQPMTSYDSLGNPHNVSLYFVKTANNEWQVHSVDTSSGAAAQDLGKLQFDTNGQLAATSATSFDINMAAMNGSTAGAFTLDFTGTQQQYATASSVSSQDVNGYSAGDLTKYSINDDGTITGTYSNGETQLLGQIVLANFANPQGLKSDGNNSWTATSASGQAIVGTAGNGNFGTLTAGALEGSNVDLSKELVNMIVAQRDYQSNAQTIKAQNAIMQTLVSLT
ncbi:flagellar hook protein FlgE [Sodalis sp. RH21]|uniref:flagellar hook protein FlgE n=1 Tax=unclassified Sodalis (in: enterobacteria) TaxID=2636512 RepID=UPI0039B5CBF8